MESLESFPAPDTHIATFQTDELTARCPFDFGGPDFYQLLIRYEPDNEVVESKSLKEYLHGYRDTEITAEALAAEIHGDIAETITPKRLYVRLRQARRGGIETTIESGDYELSP